MVDMKILAFSDFHGLYGFKNYFRDVKIKLSETNPDILIFCGDFRNSLSFPLLRSRLRRLKFPRIYLIWGNSDSCPPEFDLGIGTNVHLYFELIEKDLGIIGIGGDELDVEWNIAKLEALLSNINMKFILVSHVPPFGICDFAVDQRHVGSKPLRDFVDKYKPILHLFGHIHEESQKKIITKTTTFWNVGPKSINLEL